MAKTAVLNTVNCKQLSIMFTSTELQFPQNVITTVWVTASSVPGGRTYWGSHVAPEKPLGQVLLLTALACEGTAECGHLPGPLAMRGPCTDRALWHREGLAAWNEVPQLVPAVAKGLDSYKQPL